MDWIVSLWLTTISPWAPLCDVFALWHPTLHLFLVPYLPPPINTLSSLSTDNLLFNKETKESEELILPPQLPASTLNSNDPNICPHSLHLPFYFNGCPAFSSCPPPWSSTKHDSYNQWLFFSKQPPLSSIFLFSYQPFLCSSLNKISYKTCHNRDLHFFEATRDFVPTNHHGNPMDTVRWCLMTASPLPVQWPVLCNSLSQQPTTSSFLKHIFHLVSGIPLSWFYFSGHSSLNLFA